MKILVACEESQAVTIEMRKLGHEAFSCDIQECSGGHPEWHIRWDAESLVNGNCSFMTCDGTLHKLGQRWDMLIAHPSCQYLSNAGAARLYPRKGELNKARYEKGLEAKRFFWLSTTRIATEFVLKIQFQHEFMNYRNIAKSCNPTNTVTRTVKKRVCGLRGYPY